MYSKKILPVWYGGGIGNNRNAVESVGHLNRTGLYIPKFQHYEYKQKPTTNHYRK